jgi:acyl-CoA synthetase (NDP forming)
MQDARAGHWVLRQAAAMTAQVAAESPKPLVFFSNTTRHFEPDLDAILEGAGVPFPYGTREVLGGLRALLKRNDPPVEACPVALIDVGEARRALKRLQQDGGRSLLALAEVELVRELPASSADEAVEAGDRLGYPVVLKLNSPDVAHKTEIGGVALDLRDAHAVRDAFDGIVANARRTVPAARVRGVAVQEMIVAPLAELIVSCERDPTYGPFVMCGLGGIFAEIFDDVAVRLAPVGPDEARAMLDELRAAPVLAGARGRPKADLGALARAISGLSRLGVALGEELTGIELNPLLALGEGAGARAVDLLVTARDIPDVTHAVGGAAC